MAFCPANNPPPAPARGRAGLKRLAGIGPTLGWGSARDEGHWARGRGFEKDGQTREGVAGLRPSPLPLVKPGRGSARLGLPQAGKPVQLLDLGAKSQPGPAGMELAFPGGLESAGAGVHGAAANPSSYLMVFLRCRLSSRLPRSGSPKQTPGLRAPSGGSGSSGRLHRVPSRDAALNFPT